MIYGFFHPGSGLGNQLHRYVATRTLAMDKGYEFSMIDKQYFKGKSFMNLDFGANNYIQHHVDEKSGKITAHSPLPLWEEKTNYYNPEFNFIEDNTIIDGEFQSIRYFGKHFSHRVEELVNEIDQWLEVEPLKIPEDVCVIGFRGGEFYAYPELGLPKSYFEEGMKMMKKISPKMRFEVHTDDPKLAQEFFPDLKVVHDIGINWRSMRYAKYAIIANSSFFILPRLLRHQDWENVWDDDPVTTIAPRYWARRNTKEWSRPDNYYPEFTYV